MGLILDSTLIIADERKRLDLAAFVDSRDERVVIAAITVSELLHGCHRANNGDRRRKRTEYVEKILSGLPVLPFSMEEARHHARIWSELAREGKLIGSNDLLIAATALSLGYTLATMNRGEFIRVPGLALVPEDELAHFRR